MSQLSAAAALEKLGFQVPTVEKFKVPEVSGPVEGSFERDEVEELCRKSPDFLAGIAMPTIFEYYFPPVFLAVWNWLLENVHKGRAFPQLALGLPRGFGKTTFIKLFILYTILFTNKKFIAIFGATATKAENILSDVIDMLNEPNIKAVFGDWKIGIETDTKAVKKFGFRGRNIVMTAMGRGGSFRGMNLKNLRPDLMVFDDIQEREDADSPQVSEDIEKWLYGTAMKAKDPKGCMYLFIANMYPTDWSLLKRLKKNPSWIKFIAGGILEDGTSLWEDLHPINQLMSELQNDLAAGRQDIFFAEVLNDEFAQANNLVDLSNLPPLPYQEGDITAGKFLIIDPASGKIDSDAVSIGYFEVHGMARPVLRAVVEDRFSPGDTIRQALKICLATGTRLIGIESTAYQSTLSYWFRVVCQQLGIVGIHCVELYPGHHSKNARILQMLKAYKAGEIYVDPVARAAVHMQITRWNPLRRDNTDGVLDLLAYAPRMISEYAHVISATSNVIEQQEFEASGVVEDNCPWM